MWVSRDSMAEQTVAIIGGGGREVAQAEAYSKSKYTSRIIGMPGNDMMAIGLEKSVKTFPKLKTTDVKEIVALCKEEHVSLVDVAQENAIEAGLVDALEKEGIPVLGPTKAAGQIEWDKPFFREEIAVKYGLPQPIFMVCRSEAEGIAYLEAQPDGAWFVKAGGLCEGKGALPAKNRAEAIERIHQMRSFKNGAGSTYLIEEWLRNSDGTNGEEFSTFGISDGETIRVLGDAQDHKRVNNFDTGENTGGTGCSTPPLVLTENIKQQIQLILNKTILGLQAEGRPYKGILYLGGMLVRQQEQQPPKLYFIEPNARWGDPEAEVIVPGIKNDFFEMAMMAINGELKHFRVKRDGKARVSVAGMSRGYPGNYEAVKGKRIHGLDEAMKLNGVKVYGAGIKVIEGKYFAMGGRLFHIVGEGKNVIEARERAYSAMSLISIDGNNLDYRTDIGWRDVARLYINA